MRAAELELYAIGVRLEQAQELCAMRVERVALHAAIERLTSAIRTVPGGCFPEGVCGRLLALVGRCSCRLEQSDARKFDYEFEKLIDYVAEHCQQLETIISECIESVDADGVRVPSAFALGREIVNGASGPVSHPFVEVAERASWQWFDPDRLNQLTGTVGVELEQLFPEQPAESDWLNDLPAEISEWNRIESGLTLLCARAATSDDIPRDAPQQHRLSKGEQDIIAVVRDAGNRLTTKQILAALQSKFGARSEGMTKQQLSGLVKRALLDNRQDCDPKGYGLPEWNSPR